MSQDKLFVQLISGLEEKEFYKVAKLYLNLVDGYKQVVITNGPYDSGNDLKAFDSKQFETQYQVTTIENKFEKKLFDDLAKAKKNVEEFALPSSVKYFYSYPLSEKKNLTYRKNAKDTFGLSLDLIDSNRLAQIATVYEEIGKLIYSLSEIEKYQNESDFFEDDRVKAFYDLMSFGSSTDIKYNIIKAFVLNHLCKIDAPIRKEDLLKKINENFSSKIVGSYFESFISRLFSEKRIQITATKNIELSEQEKIRVKEVLERFKIEEGLFLKELTNLLEQYSLQSHIDDFIGMLIELYESNYSINLSEFTKRDTNINDLRSATNRLKNYIEEKTKDKSTANKLAQQLTTLLDNNEIIAKIAAGKVYSKVSDPDRLKDYINTNINNKNIFLDTNVIIHLLCAFYDSDTNYHNFNYKVAKQLLNFFSNYNLRLKTIRRYAVETTSIFTEALAIIPYTKLKIFDALGGSNNVLYRFYTYLHDNTLLSSDVNSFEDFLKEFKFESKEDKDYNYKSQMEHLLESLGVEIEDISTTKTNDFGKTVDLIKQDLKFSKRFKPTYAIESDAFMFGRLGNPDVNINPLDPIFCTWDLSLIRVRKEYFNEFPNCTQWFMFTPTRLMDHFSMMNFQVKPGTVSNEVLSILDEDFGLKEYTKSLLDTMLTIINPQNEVGLKYINKLGELRKNEIHQVDLKHEEIQDSDPQKNSVDVVFNNLFTNYIFTKDSEHFNAVRDLFTKIEYFDEVFKILSVEVKHVSDEGRISSDLFKNMDLILSKSLLTDK